MTVDVHGRSVHLGASCLDVFRRHCSFSLNDADITDTCTYNVNCRLLTSKQNTKDENKSIAENVYWFQQLIGEYDVSTQLQAPNINILTTNTAKYNRYNRMKISRKGDKSTGKDDQDKKNIEILKKR